MGDVTIALLLPMMRTSANNLIFYYQTLPARIQNFRQLYWSVMDAKKDIQILPTINSPYQDAVLVSINRYIDKATNIIDECMFLVLSMSGVSLAYSHKEHLFGLLPPIHLEDKEDEIKSHCRQYLSDAVQDLTESLHLPPKITETQVEGLLRKELADVIVERMGNPPEYLQSLMIDYDIDDQQVLAVYALYCQAINQILKNLS